MSPLRSNYLQQHLSAVTYGGLIATRCAESAETLLAVRQARTALADTPGSLFAAKCEALQSEQKYAELLEQLVQHFDLLFSKDSERGAPHRSRLCRCWEKSCGSECAPSLLSVP